LLDVDEIVFLHGRITARLRASAVALVASTRILPAFPIACAPRPPPDVALSFDADLTLIVVMPSASPRRLARAASASMIPMLCASAVPSRTLPRGVDRPGHRRFADRIVDGDIDRGFA